MTATSSAWEHRDPETVRSYADLLDRALAEAEALRETWSVGEPQMVDLADRLLGFLRDQADHVVAGELPSRELGFGLTRFMDDYEWRPQGAEVQTTIRQLSDVWWKGK